ncbi:MAG: MATE family efflux transporter [Balneolaceae bacterium]|nr:MAG: MATE family efflux transporter [Balneolaceae bacterium]
MNRNILRLAVPNIISNLSVPLLGAVDTALIGNLDQVWYLGALAIGSVIFNFIFWGFGFLRMGTTGLTAQGYGKEEAKEVFLILVRVQLIALGIGLLILLFHKPIFSLSLLLIDSSEEVARYTQTYYDIRIFTAPAVLALYGLNGWFLGMQNAKYPMIITIVMNLLNIILNVLFIYGFGMTVEGVAWGTLISTWLALFLALLLFMKKYRETVTRWKFEELMRKEELKKYFIVNRDIFIRTLCLIFTFSFFTVASSAQGDLVLAANTILLQFWFIASYGIDGFAFAAESLVGRFKGSADQQKMKQAVLLTLGWGLVLGLAGTLIYALLGNRILQLFTGNEEVLLLAGSVLIWTILSPLVSSISYVLDGVYIGATATRTMRNTMILSTVMIFLPVYYLTTPLLGPAGLWLAMILFMISRGAALAFYLPKQVFTP